MAALKQSLVRKRIGLKVMHSNRAVEPDRGTSLLRFFTPAEMFALAREAGFRSVRHVLSAALAEWYFAARTDGLAPAQQFGELLVATT